MEFKDLKSETKLDVKSDFGIMIFLISHKTPHLRRPFELDVVHLFVWIHKGGTRSKLYGACS